MRAVLSRFDNVGPLRPSDLGATLDRRTAHYRNATSLARNIIRGIHRVLSHGEHLVWTFLIPTPLMIEVGLRRELARHLEGDIRVEKRSFALEGTSMRMNPDLVFGDVTAVGDVKYRIFGGDWSRADLNQIVAFAASAHTARGLVIGFHPTQTAPLPGVGVGDFRVSAVCWRADAELDPAVAAAELAAGVRDRLNIPAALAA
jgi:5-methylcytosine-specific restriction endonuclease McrBC regulatory subunit McrC